jgi:hypothetical protein
VSQRFPAVRGKRREKIAFGPEITGLVRAEILSTRPAGKVASLPTPPAGRRQGKRSRAHKTSVSLIIARRIRPDLDDKMAKRALHSPSASGGCMLFVEGSSDDDRRVDNKHINTYGRRGPSRAM